MEARIEHRDAVVMGPSLTKVVKSQASVFAGRLSGGEDEVEDEDEARSREAAVNKYVREVLSYKFEMQKVLNSLSRADKEVGEYTALLDGILQTTSSMEAEIADLEEELALQQRIRTVKETLETRAKAVNTLPTQPQLQETLAHVEAEQGIINDRLAGYDSRLFKWRRTAMAIQQSLEQHTQNLDKDDKGVVAAAASVAMDEEDNDDDDEDASAVNSGGEDEEQQDEGDGRAARSKAKAAANKSSKRKRKEDEEEEGEEEDDNNNDDDNGDGSGEDAEESGTDFDGH
jgi:hypothetical protein